ncbi:MAG TPA: response regulator [Candidatus Aquilonibacter sp.]|nr:response regulator [Candidatus Aquilonibacter sp.]
MQSAMPIMVGHYDYPIVLLSIVIAMVASYAALDLSGRVSAAQGFVRCAWLSGGAAAMGLGIWSMHYVGMLAFHLPVQVLYDWPTVLLSLIAAVLASAIALFVVSREKIGVVTTVTGSLFMGAGIAGMHYIGMAAMRLPAMCRYSPAIVSASVLLAIGISFVALFLADRFKHEKGSGGWRKLFCAVVMGAAIPAMHYTGMAAATFFPAPLAAGALAHALSVSTLGVTGVTIVSLMVLGIAIVTSLIDRRLCAQALELEISESHARQILDTSFDAFIAMDANGVILNWNVQAESLFGWYKYEVIGKSFASIAIPERERIAFEDEIRQLAPQRPRATSSTRFEVDLLAKDLRKFSAEITVSVTQTGDALRYAAFVRDLTERKRTEKALREAKETAEEANQAKSLFLATMSHEIRTPMNGILGMTELALDTELTEEQREHLTLVRHSAESLLTVINDILDFSKIEAGKLELESIPFDLRESLGETMKALSIRAHQKGLELVYDVDPSVPESLVGDPSRLRQIVVNLVGNAIKFTERGEVLVLVTEETPAAHETTLRFTVRDTGIGIPEHLQHLIFEAFSQGDGSMTRKFGGTGLGLAICKRLVHMMDGRLWVKSMVGRGSSFHFTARLKIQDSSPKRNEQLLPEQLREMHALIVDDNFTNRRLLEGILSRWGMKPTAVADGALALQALQVAKSTGHPFPLVLLDSQMPVMDGFTVAEKIKRNPDLAGATIMMLTSASHLGDAARCRELGISAYLVKPIRQTELHDAICQILAHQEPNPRQLVTRHSLREDARRGQILLVEDNAVNRTLAVRLLEKRGFSVTTAENGRAALTAIEKEKFDAVLMDVQMPEMDGFEATAAIRQSESSGGRHLPIIAMTAHALKSDEERCIASGMDAYISKPIRTSELFAVIDRVLANQPASAPDIRTSSLAFPKI